MPIAVLASLLQRRYCQRHHAHPVGFQVLLERSAAHGRSAFTTITRLTFMSLWSAIVWMYSLVLLGVSVYGLNQALLCVIFWYHRSRQRAVDSRPVAGFAPAVTIQLPLYNELYVAEGVIRSACEVDYPGHLLDIQVLDDSTDETLALTRRLVAEYGARGVSIDHVHRGDRCGFKSGALANGLARARGELIVVFDADFVVPRDFLQRVVPQFADPSVGIVQTRWTYSNDTFSEVTRAMALALDSHFIVEQSARYWAGWFLNFNGTAGVLRARAIADAGGWQDDTLTEDFDLSYRMQLAGWRVLYRRDVACESEIPADIASLKTQQFRWSKGIQQTAQKLLPRLWRSTYPLSVKCEGTVHLLGGLSFPLLILLTLLSPGMLIATAIHHEQIVLPIIWLNGLSIAGSWCCAYTAARDLDGAWRSRILRLPVLLMLSIGFSAHNARATLEGILGKPSPFERTPKYRARGRTMNQSGARYRSRASWGVVAEFALAAVAIVSVVIAITLRVYVAIPIQLLLVIGYTTVGLYSLGGRPAASQHVHPVEAPASAHSAAGSLSQGTSTVAPSTA
jgi:cellulose synthase/poly-beta-1,6-N-acetylglucosamine synthase-like glycosyltransferase